MDLFSHIALAGLATLFIATSAAKLLRPAAFRATLAELIPTRAVAPAAGLVIAAELLLAVVLTLAPRPGAALAAGFVLASTAFVALRLARGGQVDCGCWGGAQPINSAPKRASSGARYLPTLDVTPRAVYTELLAPARFAGRNAVVLALALGVWVEPWASQRVPAAAVALGVVAVLPAAGLLANIAADRRALRLPVHPTRAVFAERARPIVPWTWYQDSGLGQWIVTSGPESSSAAGRGHPGLIGRLEESMSRTARYL